MMQQALIFHKQDDTQSLKIQEMLR